MFQKMVVSVYIFQHLMSLLLAKRQFNLLYVLMSFCAFAFIYLAKNDTYDLLSYTSSVSYAEIFEPFFYYLIKLIGLFLDDERAIIGVVQIFLSLLFFSLVSFVNNKNKFVALVLISSSLAFTLAVNNNLRQGIASVLLLYSIITLLEKRYILYLLLTGSAFMFHKSSILFSLIIFMNVMIFHYVYSANMLFGRKISIGVFFAFSIIASLVGIIFLVLLLHNGFYSAYLTKDFTDQPDRYLLSIKIIPVLFVFIASEYLMKGMRQYPSGLQVFRVIRGALIILMLIMSFIGGFDEIGSRVLYFYFAVELGLILLLYNSSSYYSVILILLSYTFAFNAWSILGG